jgi:hypothetical protein
MLVVVLALSLVIYRVFKDSPGYQADVASRIETDFQQFLATAPATLKVAEEANVSYFANLRAPWKYRVDGGTLVVSVPVPTSDGTPQGNPLPSTLREPARTVLHEFILGWVRAHLRDTAKKDFALQVKFADE